ncbi:hypothetical protein VNO77_15311 [Canavalia gladiata]|uniref:Uncharacterized protein n=1 Tax=Canavalia gladiata TaxID=3824 RepID=A0AAN9LZE8_CANGL
MISENDENGLNLVSTSLGANPSLSQQLHWPRCLQHVKPTPYIWAHGVMAIGANLGPEMTRPKHSSLIHLMASVLSTCICLYDQICGKKPSATVALSFAGHLVKDCGLYGFLHDPFESQNLHGSDMELMPAQAFIEPDFELEITAPALFLDRLCKLFCIVNSLGIWLIWSTMDKGILSELIVSNPPICSHFFWNIQILCSTGKFFSIGLSSLAQYEQQPH